MPNSVKPTHPLRNSWHSIGDSSIFSLITAPVIYLGIIPIVLLDIYTTVYQKLCFKDYGLLRVSRRGYILRDRHKLGYLNWIERINCDYCAYFNGVIAYAREVAGRTELHFCPIRNATLRKHPHAQYSSFTAYGDAAAYEKIELKELKRQLTD
jgi:hypothetical protein